MTEVRGAGWAGWVGAATAVVLVVTVLNGCGTDGDETPAPTSASAPPTAAAPTARPTVTRPAPEVVTDGDSGSSFTLAVGASTSLRLGRGPLWGAPEVDGPAVAVVRVSYERDPGYTEYQVHGVRRGTATVRVGGEPGCEARSACPDRPVVVTFAVDG